ncbi:hypothetical protein BDY19DRAFT_941069 [Irpex rosettiformis]|uniref:Uncharacterized protein n=1 Tax=Irpex rosettiformis TaxID=378272 RepID=A0ACB8U6K2_9APHY|nr:hypothetical protein BDY19DRAFT_941069 [Irpex rosettiformis]
MTGHIVGEIPPETFVNLLPPVVGSAAPQVDFSKVPKGSGKEDKMYLPFVEAVKESSSCPGFVLRNTSTKKDAITHTKPDCGLFDSTINESDAKTHSMSLMDIVVEIKPEEYQDAFHSTVNDGGVVKEEKAKSLSKMTNTSIKHRGQQIDYASQIMALQHRSHIFSISVIGHHARLIRWDRAGACVSERFNYANGSSNWLGEFLFRYANATREQRGFDHCVQKANKDEIDLLNAGVNDHLRKFHYPAHLDAELSRTVDESYPAYKVSVKDQATEKESDYIICRPFTEVFSLCGRATRGYLAWGVLQHKLVFLKDTWRADSEVDGLLSEAEAYGILGGLNLEVLASLLPIVLASGDVTLLDGTPQCTLTQDFADPKYQWFRPTAWLRKHLRHRVVQELALPLRMVRNSLELLKAIRNTLEVIKLAYHEGHVLHRDISIGNVMLNMDFNGILNDWDHAIRTSGAEDREGHPYRTGTWQFMSVGILMNATKPHSIHDDVESTFWVLYYIALHYFECVSGQPNTQLFDEYIQTVKKNGQVYYTGGSAKSSAIIHRQIQEIIFRSQPLTRAIHRFAEILRKYHFSQLLDDDDGPTIAKQMTNTGEKVVGEVDAIIQIFDDAIASKDWPPNDAALENQFPQQQVMDSHREMAQARERSYALALSKSTASRPISQPDFLGAVPKHDGVTSSGLAPSVIGATVGEEFISHSFRPVVAVTESGRLPSGSIISTRTSSKRPLDDDDDQEGVSGQQAKRAKKETGFVNRIVGALTRKVGRIIRGRKD